MVDFVGVVRRCILLETGLDNKWNASQTSVFVSQILDHIGYNREIVQYRQRLFTTHLMENSSGDVYGIYAGSKAEGLSNIYIGSDIDMLNFLSDIICTTNPQQFLSLEETPLTIFRLEQNDTAPGYAKLVLEKCIAGTIDRDFLNLFKFLDGKLYLCSDRWRNVFRRYIANNYVLGQYRYNLEEHDSGPSIPVQAFNGILHGDNVLGIICDCPNILQSWLDRPRHYSWPSAEVLREIYTMEGYAVPTGYKGSANQNIEWRICFTKAEIRLVQSLSDSQLKLIILLKMVAKIWLKPICKEMTTYVMKNLVMWIVEGLPPDYFTETRLLQTLSTVLRVLKKCLWHNRLPSYMIPERNLLADRMTTDQRQRLCMMIDILQGEGPLKLLEWDRLGSAVNLLAILPDAFFWLTQIRSEIEILILYFRLLSTHDNNTKRHLFRLQCRRICQTKLLPVIVYFVANGFHLMDALMICIEYLLQI